LELYFCCSFQEFGGTFKGLITICKVFKEPLGIFGAFKGFGAFSGVYSELLRVLIELSRDLIELSEVLIDLLAVLLEI
jgi:hypothetical protein